MTNHALDKHDSVESREGQSDYHRHLAAEIVAMLPYVRAEAWGVLRAVVEMLKLTVEPCAEPPEIPGFSGQITRPAVPPTAAPDGR